MGKGAGTGAHSHDDEYPDDNWNLYQHVERAEVLNAAAGSDATKVLRPFVRRLETEGSLVSDGDEELLVKLTFLSPVSLRRLMVIGSGDPDTHPARVKVYVGKEDLSFQSLEDTRPNFETALPLNQPGEAFVHVHPPGAFTNVTSLAFFFPANHGNGDETSLQYLGLQGDHSHDKREAVDATYELVCQHSSVDVAAETWGAMGL
eukprot:CAMPEP_0183356770 /NCGR_PEP_ID=MMETSP0164_2-20130417/45182_1 /TAXON_ID=221442 /ORGANISM="Coccolithus pelagicus ssp braarudi, Strain PLY182g" /LENGTH=203 /DNA_ID=CAMNT_0025530261 /DNA_START=130 /DNA_END=738 /DNA_ORIENTATION=-